MGKEDQAETLRKVGLRGVIHSWPVRFAQHSLVSSNTLNDALIVYYMWMKHASVDNLKTPSPEDTSVKIN